PTRRSSDLHEVGTVGGVSHSNAPAVHILHIAVLDEHIIIPGNAGGGFVQGLEGREIDAAVVHVLVVDIAVHMADVQRPQADVAQGAGVLGHHSHTGAV